MRRQGYLFYSDNIASTADSLLIALQPAKAGSKIVLRNLFFAFNSAEIEAQSNKEIAYLVDFMRQNPKIRIEITGHTDNVGTENYNLQLSQARANALRQLLIERGVSANRMTAQGKGSTDPIATNDTDEGRQTNRRVEIEIVE